MDEVARLRGALETAAWTLRNESYALRVVAALDVMDIALGKAPIAVLRSELAEAVRIVREDLSGRDERIAARQTVLAALERLQTLERVWNQPLPKSEWEQTKAALAEAQAEVERLAGGPTLIKSLARAERDLADAQAEIRQIRLDADHEWALWYIKWEKSLDTCASHSEMAIKAEAALAAERETIRILREANGTLVNSMLVMARHSSVLTVRS